MIEIILKSVQDYDYLIKELEKERRLVGTKDHKTKVGIIKGLEAWKSSQQNSTFHDLLGLLWESNCSSYLSYDDMRTEYKKIAGLVKVIHRNNFISDEGKRTIWNAIKRETFTDDDKRGIIELLKGRIEQQGSWADATKKKATLAIQCLLREMDDCRVSDSAVGKKYEEIREKLEKDNY